jgi:hypothetical protein
MRISIGFIILVAYFCYPKTNRRWDVIYFPIKDERLAAGLGQRSWLCIGHIYLKLEYSLQIIERMGSRPEWRRNLSNTADEYEARNHRLTCKYQGWAKLVLIALERYSVALKRLTFNLR